MNIYSWPISDSRVTRRLIAELADEFLNDGGKLARDVADRIHSEVEGLPADDDLRDATLQAGEDIVRQIAGRLRDEADMEHFHPPASAIEYAEEYVHRGIDLPVLLGVSRIGYAEFARQWSERFGAGTDAPPQVQLDALGRSLLAIFTYVDTISAALTAAFTAERERWSRSVEAMRIDLVRSILEGQAVDPQTAAQKLGHRLDLSQLAFVVWSDMEDAEHLHTALHDAAREIVLRAGAERALLVPLGGKTLAGWIAGPASQAETERFKTSPLAIPEGLDVRATVGTPAVGLSGFRSSHREAQQARRVARAVDHGPNGVTLYSDVALLALASVDIEQATAFVETELGALAGSDEATRRAADTLRVYLEEGRNRARTSRRLGLHHNTVAYRLTRAAELLGHPIDQRAAEVQVALAIAPLVEGTEQLS